MSSRGGWEPSGSFGALDKRTPTKRNAPGRERWVDTTDDADQKKSAKDSPTPDNNDEMEMVDQPFAASEIGESMDADLLPELSGETWVASALTE